MVAPSRIVTVQTVSGDKRLGKFTVDEDSGQPIFLADLQPHYRDVVRGGYSINYALWLASQAPPYEIRAFYFWDRDHGVVATAAAWARYHVPGGKGEWGQNITLPDVHWDVVTHKPRVAWLDGRREEEYLRLTPTEVPATDVLSDEERAEIAREVARIQREMQRQIWTSDLIALKAELYTLFARANPHLGYVKVNESFERWWKRGGEVFNQR